MQRVREDNVQAFLLSERVDTQNRFELLMDAFGTMERTLEQLIVHLCNNGRLDPSAEFILQWRESVTQLRRRGMRRSTMPGEEPEPTTSCPGCKAVLKNVEKPGDRCDWCGFVFPLVCPSCDKELQKLTGNKGDLCLWCQHQF